MIKNRKVKILMAVLCSFFSCIVMFCDRSVQVKDRYDFINAIRCDVICTTVVGCLLILAFYWFLSRSFERKILKVSLILAAIFSLCELFGWYMDRDVAFFNIPVRVSTVVFNVVVFLGYLFLFVPVLVLGLNYLTKKDILGKFTIKNERKYFSDNTWSVFSVACFLIVFWSIYYLIFFPGVVTADSSYQIKQGLGFERLTDEHPFLHTVIESCFIKIGMWIFGNVNAGIACFSMVQMVTISIAVSLIIRYLARKGIPEAFRFVILLFYALHPVIAAYSVTLWKDVWMGVFVLVYIIFLFEICHSRGDFFKSKRKIIFFMVSILCVLFSKGTGIIIIVLSLPFCFKFAKRYYKSLLVSIVICFSLFFTVRYTVINYFNVKPGHIREPMSVPIQQIARTVKYHKDELTESEYKTLNEIFPVDKFGEWYEPRLSDKAKGVLNEENFVKDPLKYAALWAKLGLKHPFTYLDSFLANSYGYWYPETVYLEIASEDWLCRLNCEGENKYLYDSNYDNYHEIHTLKNIKLKFANFNNITIRKLPGINLFFSIGIFFWIDLLCMVIARLKKKYFMMPIFATLGAVFLICIGSPVHAECRYAYAALFTLPIVILYTISDKNSICDISGEKNK